MTDHSAQVPAAAQSQPSTSLFDSVKLGAMNLWNSIKESKGLILDSLLFFGVGFLIGFFLRKYGQYVAACIVFMVCLVILAQFHIVDIGINWQKIQQVFGLQHLVVPDGQAVMPVYWNWLKINIIPAASFCVGFLVGLRMS